MLSVPLAIASVIAGCGDGSSCTLDKPGTVLVSVQNASGESLEAEVQCVTGTQTVPATPLIDTYACFLDVERVDVTSDGYSPQSQDVSLDLDECGKPINGALEITFELATLP
ncbi:MAG: hypothetical protein AAFQ82_20875 [Myxococcota bacterium]